MKRWLKCLVDFLHQVHYLFKQKREAITFCDQSSRISPMEMCILRFCLGPIKMRYSGADILNPISQADKFIFHGNKTLEVDGLHSKILWPKQLNTKMSSGASLWWMTTPVNSWKTNPYKRSSTRTVHLKFLSSLKDFCDEAKFKKQELHLNFKFQIQRNHVRISFISAKRFW